MSRPDEDRETLEIAERRMIVMGLLALPAAAGIAGTAAAAGPIAPAGRAIFEGRIDGFRGKSLAQTVQELTDREEIRELAAIYAHRVAHRVSTADLFTEDGVHISRPPGRPVREARGGRPVFERHFPQNMAAPGELLPMIHNHLIRIDGDEAIGLCSNELRKIEDGKSMIGSGYYEDRLRRVNGRWLFVVRDMHYFHYVPLQQGSATPS